MEKFRFFEHTADAKFQAFGKNIEDAFINSAYAMLAVLTEDRIIPRIVKSITVQGKDLKALLYNFLEEFLFLLDTDFFILAEIENLKINTVGKEYMLTALIKGDTNEKYESLTHIKAVTYNEMEISQEKDKFIIQVVLDL